MSDMCRHALYRLEVHTAKGVRLFKTQPVFARIQVLGRERVLGYRRVLAERQEVLLMTLKPNMKLNVTFLPSTSSEGASERAREGVGGGVSE